MHIHVIKSYGKPAAEKLLANHCPHGGHAFCMFTSICSTSSIAADVCTRHMSAILQHGQHDIKYACVGRDNRLLLPDYN